MLWSSRALAAKTAAVLSDYDLNLRLVQEIASMGDLEDARAELKQYVKTHSIQISHKVVDDFKDLKNDIQDFSKDFSKYIAEQEQKLSEEARKYEEDIWRLQSEISKIDGKIRDAAIAFGFSWLLGLLAAIPATFLIIYLLERREAEAKLDRVKADLAGVVSKQNALASMKADFAHLKPNIDDICTKLGIFAGIWAFAIEQTLEVDTGLEDGMKAVTSKKFRLKIDLLRAQIEPLQEGMRQYSTQITASQAMSNVE